MATVSDNKTLNCPICFERYILLRVLPCQHTLCEKCIDLLVTSRVGGGTECLCPLCNTSIVPPDPGLSVYKWAKAFPLHSLICSLLESDEVSENREYLCEHCKNDGQTINADVWCTDCHERLCNSCDKSHRRFKLLRHHRAVPISEMEQEIEFTIKFDQNCVRNINETLKLFCVDHRELCCSLCIATDHRQCNDVRVIDDIAREQTQQQTPAYPGIISDINEIKTEMEKIISWKAKNVTEISQEQQEIIRNVDKRIDRIIEVLNKLREVFKKETHQFHEERKESILKNKNVVLSLLTNIENSSEVLEIVQKKGNHGQKFTIFQNIATQITSHYHHTKSRLADNEEHLRMESSTVLSDIEGAMKSLERVHVTTKPCTRTRAVLQKTDGIIKKANSRISAEMCAAQVQKRDLMTSPVTFVKAVTTQKLRGTWITSGAFCHDGRLLMIDYWNKRLLQLDDQYSVVSQYKMDGYPTDVAIGNNDNEIYIAVNNQYIYKCTLDTGLKIVRRIKAPRNIWGITVSNDKIIVGTEAAVAILNQDGSVLQSIPRSGDRWSYVATSQSHKTICHTDNDRDIVWRALSGEELFRYQNQHLRGPVGICMDRHNNLYTCGYNSHNVHQVSLDRDSSRIILENLHSISDPCSVMFHPQRDELIITSYDKDTVFEVYRLG